jgi:pyruvate-formate lyase-activating enzyme
MLLLFGWGGSSKVLGEGYTLECPNCHNTRTWQVLRSSRKISVFFVPVAKWNTQYWMVCPVCSAGLELTSQQQAQEVLATALQQNGVLRTALIRQMGEGVS